MDKARKDGLLMLALGAVVLLGLGFLVESTSGWGLADFAAYYYPAKCIVQHGDPYNPFDVSRTLGRTAAGRALVNTVAGCLATHSIHPPSEFVITSAISLVPYGFAAQLWMLLNFASLTAGAFLVWNWAAKDAPVLSGVLIGMLLANSAMLIGGGNVAGITTGLSICATWCLRKERFPILAICSLALSLMLKPHDSGLLWLFFVLANKNSQKRALQVLVVVSALSGFALIWVSGVAPHWLTELSENLKFHTSPGGFDDPLTSHSMINLQVVLGLLDKNPHFYDWATYAICGLLLVLWALRVIRFHKGNIGFEFPLAAIVPLTLLITYHRTTDAPIIMLSVPALARLWAVKHRGFVRYLALSVTFLAIFFSGDMCRLALFLLVDHLRAIYPNKSQVFVQSIQVSLAPMALLIMCIFYLVLDYQRKPDRRSFEATSRNAGAMSE
jgi:hypothetical protein